MKRSKQDNSGFTLIELLIAMVIIAIVLTPLYNNFRQSTYLNGKAKAAMDATNMASNVMEGLSAFSAEEIILGFYTYDSVSNNNPLRHSTLNIMPNEVTVAEYGDLSYSGGSYTKNFIASDLDPDSSADYSSALYATDIAGGAPQPLARYLQVKPSTDGKYYFYAEGVTQARGTYDILLVLDASAETGFSGDTVRDGIIDTSSGETVGYNDYDAALISNINPLFDGVYTETTNQRANAAAMFLSHKINASVSLTEEDLYPVMRRTIIVKVEKTTDPSGNDQIKVTAEELYSIVTDNFTTASGVVVNWTNVFGSSSMMYSMPATTIFDSSVYGAAPRDIYIYYTGNYNSRATRCLDYFNIQNPQKVPINIHLMRVMSSETTEDTEDNYYSGLIISEPKGTGYVTDIYSNLRDNLKKDTDTNNRLYRNSTSRQSVEINSQPLSSAIMADYNEIVHETGGIRMEKRDRLYAVTMYVYQEGAAAAGFPEELLITEFDGNSAQ